MKQILASILLLIFSLPVLARQAQPSIDEAGRTLARCLAEVEHLRAICRSPADVLILEAKLKSANDLLGVYKAEVDRLTGSAQARTTANNARTVIYEERIKGYETRLLNNEAEVKKLRKESFRLRRGRNIAVGVIIGLSVGIAWALGKN